MKILRFSFIILMFAFVFTSCSDDWLTTPDPNNLSDESYYRTQDDFEAIANACYSVMAYSNLWGSNMGLLMPACDDRTLQEQSIPSQLQYDASSKIIQEIFEGLYIGLYRTNLFLEKISNEVLFETGRRESITGEVYFMRAFYLFHLATFFEVPPMILETSKDPLKGWENSTQEEIYTQAESDLLKAVELLPWQSNLSSLHAGRASKGAAYSLLGKVYLFTGQFEEATATFGQVIKSNEYQLNMPQGTDSIDFVWAYLANFSSVDLEVPQSNNIYKGEFNSEYIFDVNFSTAHFESDASRFPAFLPGRRNSGSLYTYHNAPSRIVPGAFANIAVDEGFKSAYESVSGHPGGFDLDPRFYATVIQAGDIIDYREGTIWYNQPFKQSDIKLGSKLGLRKGLYPYHYAQGSDRSNSPFQDPANWPIIRYADVLLMYAEASFRSNTTFEDLNPLGQLNKVRDRVGMPPVAELTKEAIIHERDIELVAEYHRFWDFARWLNDGWMSLEDIRRTKPTYQLKHSCWPIPSSEITRHYGVLKQNPKWE